MKIKYYILFLVFSIGLSLKAQNSLIQEVNDANLTLYRISVKKCPGSISHDNCFRQILVVSNSTPNRKNIREKKGYSSFIINGEKKYFKNLKRDIYYDFQDGDMLYFGTSNLTWWLAGYFDFNENNELYETFKSPNYFSLSNYEQIILKDTRRYFLGKYELENIDFYVIYVDVSFLNSKVIGANILINLPKNVRVPVIIPFNGNNQSK